MVKKFLTFSSGFVLGALLIWVVMKSSQNEMVDQSCESQQVASVECAPVMECDSCVRTDSVLSPVVPQRPSFSLRELIGKLTVTDEMTLSRNNFYGIIKDGGFDKYEDTLREIGHEWVTPYSLCRLYQTKKKPLLVIYLHGADGHWDKSSEFMSNKTCNRAQHDTVYRPPTKTRPEIEYAVLPSRELYRYLAHRREHALILCPQLPRGGDSIVWWNSKYQTCVFAIIDKLVDQYDVDTTRIYLMGTSNGSVGVRSFIENHPRRFAAALAAAASIRPSDQVLRHTPVYCVTGWQEANCGSYYAKMRALGLDCQYEYHPNWNHGEVCGYTCSEIVGNDPHYRCEKDPRLEWMFRHVK